MGWVLWLVDAGGIVVAKMQLWVTSKTIQVEWATHCVQSLIKKLNFGKSHNVNEMKTIGSVCYIILMQSCHERTKGIELEECLVSLSNAMLLHLYTIAIEAILHWMSHLQSYVLIMHGAIMKM